MTRIKLTVFKSMYEDPDLYKSFSGLYHALLPVTKAEPGGAVVAIDETKIKGEAFRRQFSEWCASNADKILGAPDPELDAVTNPDPAPAQLTPVEPVPQAAVEAADQELKDMKEAQARFRYWQGQGLLDTPENALLIESWLATQEDNHYSAAGLDRCIEANRAALMWYAPPIVEFIPGTKEIRLPLGTRPSSKHTVTQLRDLHHREQAEKSARIRAANTKIVKQYR